MNRKKIENLLDELLKSVQDSFDRHEVSKIVTQIRKEIDVSSGFPESVKLRQKVIMNTPRNVE